MKHYDVFCKGPFPDGRGGECKVQVAKLELPENKDPRRALSMYMCSVCGVAQDYVRPLCFGNYIPWWDPDYRASIIVALELPCRIFPYEKCEGDQKRLADWDRRQFLAVRAALLPKLKAHVPERELVRRRIRRKAKPAQVIKERTDKLILTV